MEMYLPGSTHRPKLLPLESVQVQKVTSWKKVDETQPTSIRCQRLRLLMSTEQQLNSGDAERDVAGSWVHKMFLNSLHEGFPVELVITRLANRWHREKHDREPSKGSR